MSRLHHSVVIGWVCASLGAALPGCGSPWQLVRQAGPNPFVSSEHRFTLRAISLDGVRVRGQSRDEFLAHEPPSEQERFDGDLRAMSERIADGLHADSSLPAEVLYAPDENDGSANAGFVIRPRLTDVDPGSYGGLVGRDAEVRMVVQIVARDGALLDEIVLRESANADMESAAAGTRLRHCADALAGDLARYLRARLHG